MRHDRKATMTEVDKLLVDSFIQPGDINRGGDHQAREQDHVETMPVETKVNRRMKKEVSRFRNKFK